MNKRRNQILISAGEIIVTEGIESLTLGKLASRANVTVPTIHNLIGKKHQIYELLVEKMVGNVRTALSAQNFDDPISAAKTFIDQLLELFRSDESLYKAAFVAGECIRFFDHESPTGIFAQSLELAREVCERAKKSGKLCGKIGTEQLANQIFACQRIARHDWVNGYIDLDTYRTEVLTGMFTVFAADASSDFHAHLVKEIGYLNSRQAIPGNGERNS